MILTNVRVRNFKSIDDSGDVAIDKNVTVLVGQNEAGKTGFLNAMEKARPVRKNVKFELVEDFPRKSLNEYRRLHATKPAEVVSLTYRLAASEVDAINHAFGVEVFRDSSYSMTYAYDGTSVPVLPVQESHYVRHVLTDAKLPSELASESATAPDIRALIRVLAESQIQSPEAKSLHDTLTRRFGDALSSKWESVLAHEVWHKHLGGQPKFLFFGDYQLMPGKVNLPSLQARVGNPAQLTEEDHTVIRLLKMADVDLKDVMANAGYEEAKARLEGLSNSITDQVFEFWTQNKELDVEFDIRPDPADPVAPFNSGPNLYIRIRNRRHRVTVPFNQRSKGFIWFFSFLVWFDSVKAEESGSPLILLLDEPGLSLHALAQGDLLRYIDRLSERHQVLYTGCRSRTDVP